MTPTIAILTPDDVLFPGEKPFPVLPAVDHYCGSEKLMQKAMALQTEIAAEYGPLAMDITCDCDGKIDRFIDLHDVRKTLPLHEINGHGEYILGVFLVGAYQETLGDLHNLLGDTNVVSVRIAENGQLEYAKEIQGDTVADVLSYVEYDVQDMVDQMRRFAETAVRNGRITAEERREIMAAYEMGLRGYTYFER